MANNLDIVFFVKQSPHNEELRYSLRSVEENWPCHKVWFYGGCPSGIKPDYHVKEIQRASKWFNVRNMMVDVCRNDDITENFWLFNDDFFVLKPRAKGFKPLYWGTLSDRIANIERKHMNNRTEYTKMLRHLVKTLQTANKGELNYAVHMPMKINRKKMLEVLELYEDEPMIRALYGNYWKIGGVDTPDTKIHQNRYKLKIVDEWDFVSTSDESFRVGNIGAWIRDRFPNKSRFEE